MKGEAKVTRDRSPLKRIGQSTHFLIAGRELKGAGVIHLTFYGDHKAIQFAGIPRN